MNEYLKLTYVQRMTWTSAVCNITQCHALLCCRPVFLDTAHPDAAAFQLSHHSLHLQPNASQRVAVTFTAPSHASFTAFVEATQTICSGASAVALKLLDRPGTSRKQAYLQGSFHPWASAPPEPILPLCIALSAASQPSQLTVDQNEACHWTVHSTHSKAHPDLRHTVTLVNTGATMLTFALATEGPFELLKALCSVPQAPERFLGSTGYSASISSSQGQQHVCLPPRESVDVAVRLALLKQRTTEDYGLVGALHVVFLNGEQQGVSLTAQVLHPCLELRSLAGVAVHSVDFGTVCTRSQRTLDLLLVNVSDVAAAWTVVQNDAASSVATGCAVATRAPMATGAAVATGAAAVDAGGKPGIVQLGPFAVLQASGVLEGQGLDMPKSCRLQVRFAPSEEGEQSEQLNIKLKGGQACSVQLMGEGTLDERDEPLRHLAGLYQ